MSEGLIVRRGGGGSAKLPGIYVTYPEGYACSISDGTKSYNAPDTGGTWLCLGLYAGTWTVTAELNGDTLTGTAVLTEGTQLKSIVLESGLLYAIGNQCESVTGGWSKTGWSYVESGYSTYAPTFDYSGMHLKTDADGYYSTISGTANAIDLTNVSTIKVTVTQRTGNLYLIVNSSKKVWDSGMVAMLKITSTGTKSLSVSNKIGSYYIALVTFGDDRQTHTATVSRIEMA